MACKLCEQLELECPQLDGRLGDGDGAAPQVDSELAHLDQLRVARRGVDPSQDGAHARDELAGEKGFVT